LPQTARRGTPEADAHGWSEACGPDLLLIPVDILHSERTTATFLGELVGRVLQSRPKAPGFEARHRTKGVADVEEVEVIVAHRERATLRVGNVFLKIDPDQTRTDIEVRAMAIAPIPTPEVLWRKPPVLALSAVPGAALGRLGTPSTSSPAAWAAAGAAARRLHDAPLPPWPSRARSLDELASDLDDECTWLVANGVLPVDLVTRNRQVAEAALRPWTPVFTHGDLQVAHVFVDVDQVTGVVDWSEAGPGDALYDLATLTLGHEEHLGHVVAGYGTDVDFDVIRAWWSLRSLRVARWLIEHGFDPSSPGCEFAVLRSRL
jgi:aminoglycoside phosphotransferase